MQTIRYRSHPLRLHAGRDALANLGAEAARLGARRGFVVCGQSIANKTDLLDRVRAELGDRYAGVYGGVLTSSPLASVEAGVAAARDADADLIVAVGGGSAVVTARAVVILLAESGTAHELCTKYPSDGPPISPRLMAPKIPNIVVATTPTTAMTRAGTAIVDPERQHRLELFDPKTRPTAVIWDADAMMTAPPDLAMSAAASAFSGVATGLAVESVNPIAEGDLRQSIRLLRDNMLRLRSEPADPDVRMNLAAASFLANRAGDAESRGAGGGFGVVAAVAHTIDTRYPACSHGAAYAIATAPGLRYNASHTSEGQARLAEALGAADSSLSAPDNAARAADAIASFYESVGMPVRLSNVGIPEGDLPRIAQDAQEEFGIRRNARPVTGPEDLMPLLREIY